MSRDAGAFPECDVKKPVTPPCTYAALGRVESQLVGLLGKGLTREATCQLQLVFHAVGWLHSMVSTDAGVVVLRTLPDIQTVIDGQCRWWTTIQGTGWSWYVGVVLLFGRLSVLLFHELLIPFSQHRWICLHCRHCCALLFTGRAQFA